MLIVVKLWKVNRKFLILHFNFRNQHYSGNKHGKSQIIFEENQS